MSLEPIQSLRGAIDNKWFRVLFVVFVAFLALVSVGLGLWAWRYWIGNLPEMPTGNDATAVLAYTNKIRALNDAVSSVVNTVIVGVFLPIFNTVVVSVLGFVFAPSVAQVMTSLASRLEKK